MEGFKVGEAPWEQTDTTIGFKVGEAPWERKEVEQPDVTPLATKAEEDDLIPEMDGFSPTQIKRDVKFTKEDLQASEAGKAADYTKQVYDRFQVYNRVKAFWDEDTRKQVEHDTEVVKNKVLKELTLQGFENPKYIGDTLFITVDGKEIEADSSLLRNMWNEKFSIAGSIGGAVVAARGAAALMPATTPYTAFAKAAIGGAAIAGGAIAGSLTSGIDTAISDMNMVTKVSSKAYLDKMKDAGITEVIFGVGGVPVGHGLAQSAKLVKHIYNSVFDKNTNGAYKALLTHFDKTPEEAMEIVTKLENLIGPLRGTDKEKAIFALTRTQRGGEGVADTAGLFNPRASAEIVNSINKVANDLLQNTKNLSADNIQAIIKQNFDTYTNKVKKFYDDVKNAPGKLTENYSFDYDKLGVQPIVESIGNRIENPTIKQRYADLLTQIGNASEGRTFIDLIDLRQAVDEIKFATKTIKSRDKIALDNALASINNEIAKVADNYMGESAKAWKDNWAKAKEQYSKMKAIEKNVLYKVLTRPGIDEETVVKQLAKYIRAGDNTFYEVVEKLPKNVRNRIDGAVLNTLVEKFTAGEVGGGRAVHFPLLSAELKKVSWSSPKAKQTVRTIHRMADVFRNDVNLARVSGNISIPKFQSYLTADPIIRLKYEIASSVFNYVKMLAPGDKANYLALVKNAGDILENPINFKAIEAMKRGLPKDSRLFQESLDSSPLLRDLQNMYIERKAALENLYGKAHMPPRLVWKKPLEAPTTIKESLDKVLYATEKGTIAEDPTSAIMKDRTDEIISDFIWQNTTKENVDIVSQAIKYMDNAKFERIGKSVSNAMRVGERERNAKMLKNIVNHQANQLIKQINKDFGVQLPKEEADKIIQLKFKELMEQCNGM